MSSSESKWSRKRSIDDIEDVSSDNSEHSKRDWRVKTLDEIRVEKEKRRRIDVDLLDVDDESSRHSFKSSATSSPGQLVIDSKAPSRSQTPTQEIIYELSPEHNSPLSTSSDTTKKKSFNKKGTKKGKEEGEILSDISDSEPGQSKPSRRQRPIDVEMIEKTTKDSKPSKEEESDESSSEDDSDSTSEDEEENTTKQTGKTTEQNSSEEEESSDTSEESEETSEGEEEEETSEENKAAEAKVEEKDEESSEEESEDSDSDSEESETSSEEETSQTLEIKAPEKQKEILLVNKQQEKPVSSRVSSNVAVEDKHKDKHRSSRDDRKHRQEYTSREDERRSHERRVRDKHDKNESRSRHDRKPTKDEIERSNRSKKTSNSDKNEHRSSRDGKKSDKDRSSSSSSSRTRDRPERHDNSDRKNHKERDSKLHEEKETIKNVEKTHQKVLTDEERLQFSAEVVEAESEDEHKSELSDKDSEGDLDVSQTNDEEKEEESLPKLPDYLPAVQGCRNVAKEFVWLNRIEEGTYGVVYRARDKKTNEIVALKRLKMEKEKEGFPITSLREINTLLKTQHPNIVTVREVVVGENMDKIFIVMDYVEHDLKTLMEHMNSKFSIGEVKTLLVQLLRAVAHLHDNWILHRDLKTSNLLLSNKGILKVADFGLAREYGSPLKPYTPIVVTLWYRAPELLLGVKEYACPIDMWSVGCIFAELLTMKPLFNGKSEIDQINKIFKDLGTPSDKIWPGPPSYSELPHVKKMTFTEYPYNQLRNKFGTHLTDKGFDLLNKFLTYDPKRRITADKGLEHSYFNESPFPVKPEMFPTWPAKSEMMKRPKKREYEHSPKPPEGGEMFSKLKDGGDSSGAAGGLGFHMPSSKKGSAAVAGFSLKFNL